EDHRVVKTVPTVPCNAGRELLAESEDEDGRRAGHAGDENEAEKRDGGRAAEVQGPMGAVACRDEQRRIVRITVKLAEPPVLGDVGTRSGASETDVRAHADHGSQSQS